jgi:LysM domain
MPVSARAGDTLQTLAAAYHVPTWAVAQINQKSESAALTEGERIVVPRYLGQSIAPKPASADAPSPAPSPATSAAPAGR